MNKVGRFMLVVLGALALLGAAPAAQAGNPFADARATVRLVGSPVVAMRCSAVVIAPEKALTAKHCADIPEMTVDGLPATVTRKHPGEDVAELAVPGLACPCAKIGSIRPQVDETTIAVGYLFGQLLITSRGEYLGSVEQSDTKEHYGVFMGSGGPGMSGGGIFRVFVTGEVELVGIMSGMAPNGAPCFYVEVSRDAKLW